MKKEQSMYDIRHKFLRRKILEGKRAQQELQSLVSANFKEVMEKAQRAKEITCQDNSQKDS